MTILVVDFSTVGRNPLNPLGFPLRKLIWESLDKAEDPSISAVVLTGGEKGGNFSAGADLTEFGKVLQATAKGGADAGLAKGTFPLPEVISRIENFSKPVVAAISGNALGGGLEVALSCHYRISDARGTFGLPEVHVGVIPGAGGTQRLPRIVGVAKAANMITTGRPIKSQEALKLGLVDHVVTPKENVTLLESAKKWAEWAALMPLDDRRVGLLPIKESPAQLKQIFEAAAKKLPPVKRGGHGVHAALKAVMACPKPVEEGSKVEGEQFFEALQGSQGKARRHAFFAERKSQKPLGKAPAGHPLLQKNVQSETVGVVGAGLMGSGICMVLLQAGFKVHLVDIMKESLDKGVAFLNKTIKSHVKKGRLSEKKAASMLKSLMPSQKLEDMADCSLVVEAVIENMKIKKSIFATLDKVTSSNCIILSNTSTLDIDEMASAVPQSRRPQFAGWHFFSPAHVMKLVEIVVGKATSLETTCILQQLTKRIGKTGVVVGNCDGFVGNRLLISYGAESVLMLEEGVASVASVDTALLKFGMAMGPLRMGDMAGHDVGYNIRKQRGNLNADGTPGPNRPARYADVADALCQMGRLGQKTGKGWYTYDPRIGGGRVPLPSTEVDNLIQKYVKKPAKPFTDVQITERALFPLVNEGFKCLEEGIANQPCDIDIIYLYGYGWPIYKGGPMYWADNEVGLSHLLTRLQEFSKQFPETDYYKPSPLLEKCVKMGLTVEQYYNKGLHKKQSTTSKL